MAIHQPGLIVLDGPDAVGKTTLANYLMSSVGDTKHDGYAHLQYFPDKELWRAQYWTLFKAMVRLSMGKLAVIDRHWPSELVYSRAYRDGTHMNGEARAWDRVVKRLCGVYIICAPSVESAVERHAATSKVGREMYEPGPQIADVAQRYRDLWFGNPKAEPVDYITQIASNGGMMLRPDAMLYDIDEHGHDLKHFRAQVFAKINGLMAAQYQPALQMEYPNFLGHLQSADTLFVGDEINPRKCSHWPFVDFGASSAAISDILHDLNFDEGRGMWTNSKARTVHVHELVAASNSDLQVIALGKVASGRLSHWGIEHDDVIHPSYAKRFNCLDTLRDQLKELL